jgi:hypothetical protein
MDEAVLDAVLGRTPLDGPADGSATRAGDLAGIPLDRDL